ncbi:MAG: hypothetical protein ACYSW8_29975, partial [Planctomycetota bacterium]
GGGIAGVRNRNAAYRLGPVLRRIKVKCELGDERIGSVVIIQSCRFVINDDLGKSRETPYLAGSDSAVSGDLIYAPVVL